MKTFPLLLLALMALPVLATPIGPICSSCQGGIYDLDYLLVASGGGVEVYNFTLTIDTTQYSGGGTYISDVAVKPASSINWVNLLSAPGGISQWITQFGALNANGCDYSGSGFVCSTDGLTAPVSNHNFAWVWQASIPAGTLLDGNNEASVKVRYADANDIKVGGLVSEPITMDPSNPVPESATVWLAGLGLVLVACFRRHRGATR